MNAQPTIVPPNTLRAILRFAARSVVQKPPENRYQFGRRKGLPEQDAAGHALRFPALGRRPGDVNDWQIGIDPARGARDFPAVDPAEQPDIHDQRAIVAEIDLEESNSLLTRGGNGWLQAFIFERGLDGGLQLNIVFDDENVWMSNQFGFLRRSITLQATRISPRPTRLTPAAAPRRPDRRSARLSALKVLAGDTRPFRKRSPNPTPSTTQEDRRRGSCQLFGEIWRRDEV